MLNIPPVMVQAPIAMTYLGSGICSYSRTKMGAYFIVIVPAVMIKSACRGLDRGTKPNLSKSKRDPIKAANSMKQQAVPKSSGHRLESLAQL
jgi:hypothetical protein